MKVDHVPQVISGILDQNRELILETWGNFGFLSQAGHGINSWNISRNKQFNLVEYVDLPNVGFGVGYDFGDESVANGDINEPHNENKNQPQGYFGAKLG